MTPRKASTVPWRCASSRSLPTFFMNVTEGGSPAMAAFAARPAKPKLAPALMKARRDKFPGLLFRSSIMIRLQSSLKRKDVTERTAFRQHQRPLERQVSEFARGWNFAVGAGIFTRFPRFAI